MELTQTFGQKILSQFFDLNECATTLSNLFQKVDQVLSLKSLLLKFNVEVYFAMHPQYTSVTTLRVKTPSRGSLISKIKFLTTVRQQCFACTFSHPCELHRYLEVLLYYGPKQIAFFVNIRIDTTFGLYKVVFFLSKAYFLNCANLIVECRKFTVTFRFQRRYRFNIKGLHKYWILHNFSLSTNIKDMFYRLLTQKINLITCW